MIAEIANSSDVRNYQPTVMKSGRFGGTFVCKQIVYAYAMRISPAFSLKVIRAYDTLQAQGVAVADHAADQLLANPMKYIEALMGQAKQKTRSKTARSATINYVPVLEKEASVHKTTPPLCVES